MNPKYLSSQFVSKTTLYLSVGLHIASLPQNCFCTSNGCGDGWQGLSLLVTGIFGFFLSPEGLAWLANPFLFASWAFHKSKASLIFSFLALIFSASFLFCNRIIANEAGGYSKITGLQLGYWLWLSSCLVTFIGHIVVLHMKFGLKGSWDFLVRSNKKYGPVLGPDIRSHKIPKK